MDLDQLPKDSFREEKHHFDYGNGQTDDKNLQRVKGGPTPIIDNETVFNAEKLIATKIRMLNGSTWSNGLAIPRLITCGNLKKTYLTGI